MDTTMTGTHAQDEHIERLLTEVAPALAALKVAQTTPDAESTASILIRQYDGGLVCALEDHGAFTFVRGADAGPSERVAFAPREARALLAFWRDVAHAEIFKLVADRKQAEASLTATLERIRDDRRATRHLEPVPRPSSTRTF